MQLANTPPLQSTTPGLHSPGDATRHLITAYRSFIDLERMKGWVGLVGWPVADGLPTSMVTRQLQVECRRRTGKVRRLKTNVLPLCHATKQWRTFSTLTVCHLCIPFAGAQSWTLSLKFMLLPSSQLDILTSHVKFARPTRHWIVNVTWLYFVQSEGRITMKWWRRTAYGMTFISTKSLQQTQRGVTWLNHQHMDVVTVSVMISTTFGRGSVLTTVCLFVCLIAGKLYIICRWTFSKLWQQIDYAWEKCLLNVARLAYLWQRRGQNILVGCATAPSHGKRGRVSL